MIPMMMEPAARRRSSKSIRLSIGDSREPRVARYDAMVLERRWKYGCVSSSGRTQIGTRRSGDEYRGRAVNVIFS